MTPIALEQPRFEFRFLDRLGPQSLAQVFAAAAKPLIELPGDGVQVPRELLNLGSALDAIVRQGDTNAVDDGLNLGINVTPTLLQPCSQTHLGLGGLS